MEGWFGCARVRGLLWGRGFILGFWINRRGRLKCVSASHMHTECIVMVGGVRMMMAESGGWFDCVFCLNNHLRFGSDLAARCAFYA